MGPKPRRGDMSVDKAPTRNREPRRGDMSVKECLLFIIIQIHGTLDPKRTKGKDRFPGNNHALSQ